MTQGEFHDAFRALVDAYPLAHIAETVEGSWFETLRRFPSYQVRAAFKVLGTGGSEKFPTLALAKRTCIEMVKSKVVYAEANDGYCYKSVLGETGKVQCGCARALGAKAPGAEQQVRGNSGLCPQLARPARTVATAMIFIIAGLFLMGALVFAATCGGPGFIVRCPHCQAKYEASAGKHLCARCQCWFRVSHYGRCVDPC